MTPEGDLKTAIRKAITDMGGYYVNVQNGPYAKPGDPDIVACVKGRFYGIEAKSPNGRLSKIQQTRWREIEEAGGRYIVARSVKDITEAFDDIGG